MDAGYSDDDLLLLSGIQHFAFCERQWALIHIEQLWQENLLTFKGRDLHERADDPFYTESRSGVIISRAVPLLSRKLGLYGTADVVEFQQAAPGQSEGVTLPGRAGRWLPFPVEYKSGQPKPDDRDMVQLCAQAICLEEMLRISIAEGALFYGKTRRRQPVIFDRQLRERVADLARRMHELFQKGVTPAQQYRTVCDSCSLEEICLPKVKGAVGGYLRRVAGEEGQKET
ncbi:MAG: CRISPR-associated protein Cas4 [Firmicutes bacterium]|nr:CRISPR-associated protein Cas4 [Bacillota bacterium]